MTATAARHDDYADLVLASLSSGFPTTALRPDDGRGVPTVRADGTARPVPVRTLRSDKGVIVQTTMTDAEAAAVCQESRNEFARGLARDYGVYKGRLSHNKLAWLHKLANESVARAADQTAPFPPPAPAPGIAPVAAPTAPPLSLPGVVAFMARAGEGACVTFQGVQVKRAGDRSKFPGSYWVTDGRPYPNNRLYGRISPAGEWVPARGVTPAALDVLTAFDADPAGFAADYGLKTGRCCFCKLALTDPVSVTVGYGPVCAKHYGLPHGKAAGV